MNQKGIINLSIPIIIAVILVVAAVFSYFYYLLPYQNEKNNTNKVAINTNINENQNINTNTNLNTGTDNSTNTTIYTDTMAVGEIKDWKTYKNNTYNYSIKYPPKWVVDDTNFSNIIIKNTSDKYGGNFTIGIDTGDLSIIENIEKGEYTEGCGYTPEFISGISGYKVSCFLFGVQYYFLLGENRYILSYPNFRGESFIPIYEQIFSSFQFTNK